MPSALAASAGASSSLSMGPPRAWGVRAQSCGRVPLPPVGALGGGHVTSDLENPPGRATGQGRGRARRTGDGLARRRGKSHGQDGRGPQGVRPSLPVPRQVPRGSRSPLGKVKRATAARGAPQGKGSRLVGKTAAPRLRWGVGLGIAHLRRGRTRMRLRLRRRGSTVAGGPAAARRLLARPVDRSTCTT